LSLLGDKVMKVGGNDRDGITRLNMNAKFQLVCNDPRRPGMPSL
jgi:hypothetical protein